jgi:iron complex outermembrane receptor protein
MVIQRVCFCLCLTLAIPAQAESELSEADFLADMPTVLTASRLSQPLMDAPNSTNVIDRKQIEASGYHNISDLFRLVPGFYVGQKRGWSHNVSHTFADEFARHIQVMVDGRTIYLATIGGVRWDTLPLSIDDIERIEVVRGPNAASFGANAFTGIINIITRHPDDVAGRMLHLAAGDHDHREAWFRWAGRTNNGSHRVTLGERRDGGFTYQDDDESSHIFNYRGEFALAAGKTLSVQLGALTGQRGEGSADEPDFLPHPQDVDSGYMQLDYQHDLSPDNSLHLKFYFNHLRTEEVVPTGPPSGSYYLSDLLGQRLHMEGQHTQALGANARTVAGAYLRRDTVRSELYWNTDEKLNADSWGIFGHVEWRPIPTWLLNVGAFWEDYELVGKRVSPRATLHWQPNPNHSFRIGISRAYRNPVMFEALANAYATVLNPDGSVLGQVPFVISSSVVKPESMLSRDIGYLGLWPEVGLTVDLRLFRERFNNFILLDKPSGKEGQCPLSSTTSIPGILLNNVARDWCNNGGSLQQGYELQLKWNPNSSNTVMLNHADLRIDPNMSEKNYSPPRMTGLHLMHAFSKGLDLSLSQYWVAGFEAIGQGSIPSYQRLDARLAKRFTVDGMDGQIALVWQNLGDSYTEFNGLNPPENVFDRRAYVHFQLNF